MWKINDCRAGGGGYTKTVKSWERGLRGEARSTSARELLTASITYIKTIYKYEGLLLKILPLRPLDLINRSEGDPCVFKTVAAC